MICTRAACKPVDNNGSSTQLKKGWSPLVSAKIMCHVQNVGQIHDMRMANESFDSVAKLKYLRMTLKNQYCVHEEMKNRFEFIKAC